MLIPLDKITRNPKQPREDFPLEYIEQLAASIKARGLIQAITIREVGHERYMIVAGECRYRAHQLLGAETIRAEVVAIDEREMQFQAIIENLQRRNMNPIEEAKAFQSLLDRGYTAEEIMQELGLKSTALVSQRTQLLNLAPDIQKLVASGQLTSTMAWGVSLASPRGQSELLRAIRNGKLRTTEQVKAAGIALRDAEAQLDAFGDMPKATETEAAALTRLERKIEQIVELVAAGFKDGECVAAQRVNPQRLATMADKLALVRRHVLQMEHDLRRVATQSEILLAIEKGDNEDHQHKAAVGVVDRHRSEGRREPAVADEISRPDPRSRKRTNGSKRKTAGRGCVR